MHLCAYHLPVLLGPPVHIHAVCQGHHPASWADLFTCPPCLISIMCLYLLFPSIHPGSLGTHVWMWDVSHCWHVVAQAHHVPAPPLGGKSTPACQPAVPCNALCRVVVWPLLFARLLCPGRLVAEVCLFTQGLCCVAVCHTHSHTCHVPSCVCPPV